MSELLPLSDCPFCGSVASYREDNNSIATGGYDYWILCGECGSTSDYYATPELAAESWNRRAPVQASEARGEVACYGMRRKGQTEIIGVIPAKVHANPPNSKEYLRDYEEVPLYLSAHTQAGPVD